MNSRLPGMCKRSLQVCRGPLEDCWITCMPLPSIPSDKLTTCMSFFIVDVIFFFTFLFKKKKSKK